jgi:5-methylcytosine-specific restriction endonuclease McrA
MSEAITPRQKARIAARARFCCEYCFSQERYSPDPFSVDHIEPLKTGGKTTLNNLAYACMGCNGRKSTSTSAYDPATGEIVPLFHPRQHPWGEHFAWNEDFSQIIGLTATGRATIEKLQLNREGVVSLRHLLFKVDKHPPY